MEALGDVIEQHMMGEARIDVVEVEEASAAAFRAPANFRRQKRQLDLHLI